MRLLLKKLNSAVVRVNDAVASYWALAQALVNPDITIATGCRFGRGVVLRATDGGTIRIGPDVYIGRNVQLIAQRGTLNIGSDVHLGTGSIIACKESIEIGADTLIAEYVVIRDQDHKTISRPVRLAGFSTSPISIGRDVWIGAKSTVLRGVQIGDCAIIGAHALVRSNVPPGMLAVGVPAQVKGPVLKP